MAGSRYTRNGRGYDSCEHCGARRLAGHYGKNPNRPATCRKCSRYIGHGFSAPRVDKLLALSASEILEARAYIEERISDARGGHWLWRLHQRTASFRPVGVRNIPVPRFVWLAYRGALRNHCNVMVACSQPDCVRPEHLRLSFAVTPVDPTADFLAVETEDAIEEAPARGKDWEAWTWDGRAYTLKLGPHEVKAQAEDRGWRLWVDGERRGWRQNGLAMSAYVKKAITP